MRLSDVAPAIRQCVGIHEAFRKLGFISDDIFVGCCGSTAIVLLRTQGKEFSVTAGIYDGGQAKFAEEWTKTASAIRAGEVPMADLNENYETLLNSMNSFGFLVALEAKGINIPKKRQNPSLN